MSPYAELDRYITRGGLLLPRSSLVFPDPLPSDKQSTSGSGLAVSDEWWSDKTPEFIVTQYGQKYGRDDKTRYTVRFELQDRDERLISESEELPIHIEPGRELSSIPDCLIVGEICHDTLIDNQEEVRIVDFIPSLNRVTDGAWCRDRSSALILQQYLPFLRGLDPPLDLTRGKRILFLLNQYPNVKFLQSVDIGPSHLQFHSDGRVARAFHEFDGSWVRVEPEHYDPTGRWTDSMSEYLVREQCIRR